MQNPIEQDPVYFLHIPKTSGTSLYHSFLRAYGPDAASPPLLWDDLVNGTYELSEGTRIVTGHFGGLLPLWIKRWPRMITILRHPVARALSHINHIQRSPNHPLHAVSAGLTIRQYCEQPTLRRTVNNLQSRYLASLDFALALMPRTLARGGPRHHASLSVSFENALFSLDEETGLLEAAVRALEELDAVGICEAHGMSLRVFAGVLGWDAHIDQFVLNQAAYGQRTLDDLSSDELDLLTRLNLIDAELYAHGIKRFESLCTRYGPGLGEDERAALAERVEPVRV